MRLIEVSLHLLQCNPGHKLCDKSTWNRKASDWSSLLGQVPKSSNCHSFLLLPASVHPASMQYQTQHSHGHSILQQQIGEIEPKQLKPGYKRHIFLNNCGKVMLHAIPLIMDLFPFFRVSRIWTQPSSSAILNMCPPCVALNKNDEKNYSTQLWTDWPISLWRPNLILSFCNANTSFYPHCLG